MFWSFDYFWEFFVWNIAVCLWCISQGQSSSLQDKSTRERAHRILIPCSCIINGQDFSGTSLNCRYSNETHWNALAHFWMIGQMRVLEYGRAAIGGPRFSSTFSCAVVTSHVFCFWQASLGCFPIPQSAHDASSALIKRGVESDALHLDMSLWKGCASFEIEVSSIHSCWFIRMDSCQEGR